MDTSKRSIRVLMFPWLAHGHISPFLELAKALAKRNFVTYICSSSINLNTIKKTLPPKYSISVKLVELQIPTTPQLPPHYHTTNGLPPHLMDHLKRALDSARPEFSTILKTLQPDLVIYDFLQPWAPEEAALQNIPAVVFFSTGAAASSFIMYHCFGAARSAAYPFPSIYIREYEYGNFCRLVRPTSCDANDHVKVSDCIKRSFNVVLMKTFREMEGKYIEFHSELTQKKVVPVGPLVQVDDDGINNDNTLIRDEKNDRIIEWLDQKDRKSTIFASFGSEYFLSENEIEEIGFGLELSKVNFIWVLRFPVREKIITIDEKLPEGFLERVRGRGMVVEDWAPQRRILLHPSVGGFLSHCGWSSVMEGIFSGVPIVAVPMHLDQPLNARLVEELGVGEEVVRGKDGRVERDEVARVVKRVVLEGEELWRRAAEMSEMMIEKGEEELDEVVEELVGLCERDERLIHESQSFMMGLNI
ncbi:hypothetical protein OROGR_009302 [Orobanche gracilis]